MLLLVDQGRCLVSAVRQCDYNVNVVQMAGLAVHVQRSVDTARLKRGIRKV